MRLLFFFFSSRRRHTRSLRDWSSDVCSSDLWREAGHQAEPRVSVSRSIMPITTDLDRMYFGHEGTSSDQFGQIEANLRAVFGKTYAAEPDVLVKELAEDEAVATADTLLLTVPNQLRADYNAHILQTVLTDVAPDLGWR